MRTLRNSLFAVATLATTAAFAQAPAPAKAPAVPAGQRAAIESVIRDYLLKNPELLREAMQALQAKEEAEKQKAQKLALVMHRARIEEDPTSPVGGNAAGSAVVVEFFDYGCPHCKRALATLEGIVAKDKDVKVVYKELPILGPESFHASRAALAARMQGKYAEFHAALMNSPTIDAAAIQEITTKLGLDAKKLAADMDDPSVRATLEANSQLAEDLGIQGTPAFIVGEHLVPGGVDINTLTHLVTTEKARKAWTATPAKAAATR